MRSQFNLYRPLMRRLCRTNTRGVYVRRRSRADSQKHNWTLASAALRLALRGEKRAGARNEGSTTAFSLSRTSGSSRLLALFSDSFSRYAGSSRFLARRALTLSLFRSLFSSGESLVFVFFFRGMRRMSMFILWGSVLSLAVKNLRNWVVLRASMEIWNGLNRNRLRYKKGGDARRKVVLLSY